MILAGDIGGTNTRLALFEQRDSELYLIKGKKQASNSWRNLDEIICDFLKESGVDQKQVTAGCLSLAGPIQGNYCQFTNLGLTIDFENVRKSLNFLSTLSFCNDLVALGYGLSALKSTQLFCLTPGIKVQDDSRSTPSNQAIIAPGTGLGESMIIQGKYVSPTEGAHSDFAPRNELEIHLWRFLHQRFGHVSNERILSGPGLTHLYRFLLKESEQDLTTIPLLSPSEITEKAVTKRCPICRQALELFIEILGAEAGNLALRSLAIGGIYLGGGIVPKLLHQLQEGKFLKAFYDKGRFRKLLTSIPIYVILEEHTALIGAARLASGYPMSIL